MFPPPSVLRWPFKIRLFNITFFVPSVHVLPLYCRSELLIRVLEYNFPVHRYLQTAYYIKSSAYLQVFYLIKFIGISLVFSTTFHSSHQFSHRYSPDIGLLPGFQVFISWSGLNYQTKQNKVTTSILMNTGFHFSRSSAI